MKRKFNTLLVLSTSLLLVSALAGCQRTNKPTSESESNDSSETSSKEDDSFYLTGVNQNANYAKYLSNIKISADRDDGFKKVDTFKVGDDNTFKFKPVLTVVNADLDPVSEENWDKPFDIKVEVKNEEAFIEASQDLYELDNLKCEITFKAGAVGKTFKLTVVPTGITEAQKTNFTQTLTFDVVDGYNVYDAKELSYFDTRTSKHSDEEMAADEWNKFKAANGLDVSLKPNTLILQHDTVITMNDLPKAVNYTADDHGATYANTLRDWAGIYRITENKDTALVGNFFQLDFSNIGLVKYPGSADHVNSHAMLFGVEAGNFTVENINVTGNSKYATEADEDIYAGSLMFVKGRLETNSITADNVIARQNFITFMGEDTTTEKGYIDFVINDSKLSNNYNSFFYNWGGQLTVNNTDLLKCGGPVVIQDHVDVKEEGPYESDDYSTIYGHPSKTVFNNCKIENYVAGSEAWFVQFSATAIAGQIKSLSDLYAGSFGLSFIFDPTTHAAKVNDDKASVFNFIGFNKSGSAEKLTNAPVCGEIIVNNGEEDNATYNYSQPTPTDLQAYVILQTFLAEVEAAKQAYAGGDEGKAFKALCTKYNVTPASLDVEGITAALTQKGAELQDDAQPVITHSLIRGVNKEGGPVFQSGGEFAYFDGNNKYLQPLNNAIPGSGTTAPISSTSDFGAKANSTTGIYYNGMLLVMGLGKISA